MSLKYFRTKFGVEELLTHESDYWLWSFRLKQSTLVSEKWLNFTR